VTILEGSRALVDADQGRAAARRAEPPAGRKRHEPLAVTAWALMANTVTTSALGVVFWGIASRLYSPEQLGEDAALVSAMILLSAVSQLNLSMGIPRLLPQVQDRRWRPVLGAYALTAVVGSVVTGGFLVLAPRLSEGFAFLSHDSALGAALVGAVVLWNIFALQDAVLTSARWAPAVPVENGLFGLLKIVVMVWLANSFISHGVFFAWLLAMAVLLLPVNGLIFGRVLPSKRGRREQGSATALPLGERRRIARYLATDYVAALLSQGSTALLPLLVIAVLGRADNAYFYVAFLIAAAAGALAHSLSTSIVTEGGHDESDLKSLARRSVGRYFTFVVPLVVVGIVAAPLLLRPFGPAYVAHGTTLLRLLLAGTLPQALVTLYLGVERVRARVKRVLAIEAATIVLVIVGALVGMRWNGLPGLGLAWLFAQVSVATVAAPRLWFAIRGTSSNRTKELTRDGDPPNVIPGEPAPVPSAPFPSAADLVDLAAALVTAMLLVVTGLGLTGGVRLALALAFVTFVPGWAVLDHLRVVEGTSRVALAVALSLTLATAAALSSLWLHLWHPRGLLDATAAMCLLALVWHLARPAGSTHQGTIAGPSRIPAPGPQQ